MKYILSWIYVLGITTSLYATEQKTIDEERQDFFNSHFTPSFNHSDVETSFKNQFQYLARTYSTASSLHQQNQEKQATPNLQLGTSLQEAKENYQKYLVLRARTVYPLPDLFEEGYLFSPRQALKALKNLGIETSLIDKKKFWTFCMAGRVELPKPKLEQEENVNERYIAELDTLIKRYKLRIKENVYDLTTFLGADLKGNIYFSSCDPIVCDPQKKISFSFLRHEDKEKFVTLEESVIKDIVAKNGFSADRIEELLTSIHSVDPVDLFERVCRGINGCAKSWNSPDMAAMPVRVAGKLQQNGDADLRPEIIETVDTLLGRSFNKMILKGIRESFVKASTPKEQGFSHNLSDDIF